MTLLETGRRLPTARRSQPSPSQLSLHPQPLLRLCLSLPSALLRPSSRGHSLSCPAILVPPPSPLHHPTATRSTELRRSFHPLPIASENSPVRPSVPPSLPLRPLDCTLFFADAESQTETKKKRGPRTLPPLSLRRLPSSSSIDLQHPPSPLPRIIHCGYYGYVGFVVSRHVVLQSALLLAVATRDICLSVCLSVRLFGWLAVLQLACFGRVACPHLLPTTSLSLLLPVSPFSARVRFRRGADVRRDPRPSEAPPAPASDGQRGKYGALGGGEPHCHWAAVAVADRHWRKRGVPVVSGIQKSLHPHTSPGPIPSPFRQNAATSKLQHNPPISTSTLSSPPPPSALPPLPCLHSAPSSNHISSPSSRTSFCPERTPPPPHHLFVCLFSRRPPCLLL